MSELTVRRVRLHEWAQVRDLRIEAVSDPAASIAFLTTLEQERARGDDFWQERTAAAALGEDAAQFVAVADDRWVGTATVLLRVDEGAAPRAEVVGVFVAASHRGLGTLGWLVEEARAWTASRGADVLTLDVHVDNVRAQAAYRKIGFVPTGVRTESVIGTELQMRLQERVGVDQW